MMKEILEEDQDFAEEIKKLQTKKKMKEEWFLLKNIKKIESVFFIQKTVFLTKFFYLLRNFIILDFDSMIYVFNEIIWFLNFWSAQSDNFLWADNHKISIQSYDNINIEIQSSTDKRLIRFHDVVFYKNFAVNLISFWQLHKLNYWWDNRSEFNYIYKINQNFITVITLTELHKQNVLKYILNDLIKTTFFN